MTLTRYEFHSSNRRNHVTINHVTWTQISANTHATNIVKRIMMRITWGKGDEAKSVLVSHRWIRLALIYPSGRVVADSFAIWASITVPNIVSKNSFSSSVLIFKFVSISQEIFAWSLSYYTWALNPPTKMRLACFSGSSGANRIGTFVGGAMYALWKSLSDSLRDDSSIKHVLESSERILLAAYSGLRELAKVNYSWYISRISVVPGWRKYGKAGGYGCAW